jgi:DNA-directed RNA polymerase
MSLRDRQIEREINSVNRGVERYERMREIDKAAGREYESTVGQRFVDDLMSKLVPAINQAQEDAVRGKLVPAMSTGRRLGGWEDPLCALNPNKVAYITLRTVLNVDQNQRGRAMMGKLVGKHLDLQVKFDAMSKAEQERVAEGEGDPGYNRLTYLKREVKRINPRSVRKWLKRLDDLKVKGWTEDVRIKVGTVCVELAVDTLPEVFEKRTLIEEGKTRIEIRVTDEATKLLLEAHDLMGLNLPWHQPMVHPPRAWTTVDAPGGWLKHEESLVKPSRFGNSAHPSETHISSLNYLQSRAWKVNGRVLTLAFAAVEMGKDEVLPVQSLAEVPLEVEPDVWESLDNSDKAKIKRERRLIHDANYKLEARRQLMRRQLAVAEENLEEPALYFPHNCDFRGRFYPLPQDLHPQADDFGKALLHFAEGKPLGDQGFKWLVFHAANAYGMDKLNRQEQADWFNDNLDNIYDVASDPFIRGYEFWSQADEPWQFMAACIEICESKMSPDYLSHLPIHVDGSCNGLQHLSAMGRDSVGAHSVNLTSDPERQDIYQIVADKVADEVSDDHHNGNEQATAWDGHVTRKTVKRGVMTLPYGVTDVGIRDQLISDGHVRPLDGDIHQNATYMRDRMKEAMEGTIEKAVTIMGWMQDNASILAKNEQPVTWTSPSGFEVTQGYKKMRPREITILGAAKRVHLQVLELVEGLRLSKQQLAIAPNIVHSFDAAHMAMCLNSAPEDMDVAAVHDSFGTHACDMDLFLDIIKDEFIRIYRDDWFVSLQADFLASRNGGDYPLIDPPAMGDYDVNEVGNSEFFFA